MKRNENYGQCIPGGMESDDDDDDDNFYDDDDDEAYCTPEQPSMTNEAWKGRAANDSETTMNGNGNHVHHQRASFATKTIAYDDSPVVDDFRMAIMHGNLATIESLIVEQQAVKVDAIMRPGWTGLMYACSFGHPEVTQFLLDKGADSNYHHDDFTPLMAACASSKNTEDQLLKCVECLLMNGARVNAFEKHRVTPLMFAAREGFQKIIQVLLTNDAQLDAMDNRGWTAFHWAISRGHIATVRDLLRAEAGGADVEDRGQSIVEFAREQGRDMIAQLLKEYVSTKTIFEDAELIRNPVAADNNADTSFEPKPKFSTFVYGDLEMFLSGLGLSNLIPVFQTHALKFEDVLQMTDESLLKIGIDKFGWRTSILNGIRTVHRKDWQESSLPNLKEKAVISCPDVVCMMGNIGKHLSYIRATVAYLREQTRANQRILETGQEFDGVRTVLKNTEDAVTANRELTDELRRLQRHLDRVQSNSEYAPADLIVSRPRPASTTKSRVYAVLFGIATAALVGYFVAYKKPPLLLPSRT